MGVDSDLILIGSAKPVFADWENMEERFSQPRIPEHLEQVDVLRFPVVHAVDSMLTHNVERRTAVSGVWKKMPDQAFTQSGIHSVVRAF